MTPSVPGLRLQRLIGEGACGRVFEAVRDGGRVCAVKVLDPEAINHAYIVYCFEKLRSLPPHPQVAPIHAFHPDDVQGPPFYAMPLLADPAPDGSGLVGRTIESRCGTTDPATAWRWIREMASGLSFLHLHAVVHCNFKTSNVFLDDSAVPRPLITDFGQGWIGGVEGLPLNDHAFYAPPEQLRQPTQIQFGIGERWDVYAFGVTAFRLLTGNFPRGDHFTARWKSPEEHGELPDPIEFAAHVEAEAEVAWPTGSSDETEVRRREVIEKCLRLAPAERWVDLREVRDALGAIEQAIVDADAHAQIEAERERWHALADEARQKLKLTAGRRSPERGSARWIGWAAAAVIGAALGGLSYFEHTRVTGLRSLLAQEHAEKATFESTHHRDLATRDAAVARAEAALAAAVKAAQLADRNLAAARLAADQFFESFLVAAKQLPAEGERSRLLLTGYDYFSKELEKNASNPALVEACLRTRCHLAEIKMAMGGGIEAAEKFDQARQHIQAFLAGNPNHPEARAFQLRAADCALNAAELRFQAGKTDEGTLNELDPALAAIQGFVRDEGAPPDLQRRVAQGEIMLAQCQMSRVTGDVSDARRRLQHAADLLNGLLADPRYSRPNDKLLLGRASLLRGQCERRAREIEPALATQIETAQILLECGDQVEALSLLAQCYGETGEMLAANGEVRDAARAQAEAVKLLSGLVQAESQRADLRFALARRYADVAQLVRDNGQPARALDYQRGAVELVKTLLDREPGNFTYAASLARLRADLSDLLGTLGQKPEALAQAREAIALLDKLSIPAPASLLCRGRSPRQHRPNLRTRRARHRGRQTNCRSSGLFFESGRPVRNHHRPARRR